ncbi:hypothetical protein EI94DRAFT_1729276 [Lactarius quietus]|nr:hypothetical protein EI94DRAFT_1729276 [Lactarius quietus]
MFCSRLGPSRSFEASPLWLFFSLASGLRVPTCFTFGQDVHHAPSALVHSILRRPRLQYTWAIIAITRAAFSYP